MSNVDYVAWDVACPRGGCACGSRDRTHAAYVVCERRRRYVVTRRDERQPTDSTVPCVTVPGDTVYVSNGWVPEAVMSLRSVACLLFRETYGTYVGLRFHVDNGWLNEVAP
jgi:hypothetical protein